MRCSFCGVRPATATSRSGRVGICGDEECRDDAREMFTPELFADAATDAKLDRLIAGTKPGKVAPRAGIKPLPRIAPPVQFSRSVPQTPLQVAALTARREAKEQRREMTRGETRLSLLATAEANGVAARAARRGHAPSKEAIRRAVEAAGLKAR
jgi:hypothetical protein